jgi:hypothetical protein
LEWWIDVVETEFAGALLMKRESEAAGDAWTAAGKEGDRWCP